MGTNYWGSENTAKFLTDEIEVNGLKIRKDLLSTMSTGLIKGGVISIGAPTSTFSISDGEGFVIDNHTVPASPEIQEVSWSGFTNVALDDISKNFTAIGIDDTGAIVQSPGVFFTNEQRRDIISLGVAVHVDHATISDISVRPEMAFEPQLSISDMSGALGIINISGNAISSNGINLNLDLDAGKTFNIGQNYLTSRKDPSVIDSPAQAVFPWFYRHQDGTGGFTVQTPAVTLVAPTLYDNAGSLDAVSSQKWTVQRFYFFPASGNLSAQYGQKLYNTSAAALQGIQTEPFETDPTFSRAALRCFLIVRGGAGNLQLDADAIFVTAGKLGEGGFGGSGGTASNMQAMYTNSTQPQIILDAIRGGIQVRDAATPIGTDLECVENNAGTVQYHAISAKGSKAEKYTHIEIASIPIVADAQDAMRVRLTNHKEFVYDSTAGFWQRLDNKIDDLLDFLDCDGLYDLTPFTDTGFGDVSLDASSFSGAQSLVFTGVALDAGDTFTFPAYTLDENEKGRLLADFFDFKYGGLLADYTMKIQENDGGWADISGASTDVRVSNIGNTSQLNFVTSLTATEIRRVLVCNADNVGAILKIDNFSFQKNPFETAKSVETTVILAEGNNGLVLTPNTEDISFTTATKDKDNLWDGTGFTALRSGTYSIDTLISLSGSQSGTLFAYIDGVQYKRVEFFNTSHLMWAGSITLPLNEGERFSLRSDTALSLHDDVKRHWIGITSAKESNNVVWKGSTSDADWTAYTPTFTGFGTVTVSGFYWRRVSDSMEVKGTFTAGNTTAVTAQISFPSGKVYDVNKDNLSTLLESVGTYYRGVTNTDAGGAVLIDESDTTNFRIGDSSTFGSTAVNPLLASLASSSIGLGDEVSFTATVPIQGWSSIGLLYAGKLIGTEHVSDGTEYLTADTWKGGPIYARSISWTGSAASSFDLITGLADVLEVLEIQTSSKNSGGNWNQNQDNGTNKAYAYFSDSLDKLVMQISTNTIEEIRCIFKYIK